MSGFVQSSPVLKVADGVEQVYGRIGPQQQLIVDALHGEMYEASRIGTLFWAANQAAQAISVALTTTYTGLALYNPVGNNRDLILRAYGFTPSIAQVALYALTALTGIGAFVWEEVLR